VHAGPRLCPDYARHAAIGQDKTEAQVVMHANNSAMLTESTEDMTLHVQPSATVQAVEEVRLPAFRNCWLTC
jgi:hypothetical protein